MAATVAKPRHLARATSTNEPGELQNRLLRVLAYVVLLGTASIIYRLNKWVSLVNEVSYIETRAATPGSKVFRGIPATVAHSWRNEFGSAFTF